MAQWGGPVRAGIARRGHHSRALSARHERAIIIYAYAVGSRKSIPFFQNFWKKGNLGAPMGSGSVRHAPAELPAESPARHGPVAGHARHDPLAPRSWPRSGAGSTSPSPRGPAGPQQPDCQLGYALSVTAAFLGLTPVFCSDANSYNTAALWADNSEPYSFRKKQPWPAAAHHAG